MKFFNRDDISSIFENIDRKIKKDNFSILCYDPFLRNTIAARKNAKIAGVDKTIKISRVDIEWLDTKIKENSIDIIASYPKELTDNNKDDVKKIFNELFYHADYILKKKGTESCQKRLLVASLSRQVPRLG